MTCACQCSALLTRLPPTARSLLPCCTVLLLISVLLIVAVPARAQQDLDFTKDIAPIFQQRCLSCHAELQAGGLQLLSRGTWLQGGESGPLVDGQGGGLLLQRVMAADGDELRMPPEGPRLTDEQLQRLTQWIRGGAVWPEQVVLQSPRAAAATHWAFQTIRRPSLPTVSDPAWPRQPIDAFVAARLAQEQLRPALEADRWTLLRRVTLDLTGLPPTPEDVAAFVQDNSENAYDVVVDRLLASPAYGERWARPWLDLCHYADTDGYLTDQKRPVAWRYRQWLIEALNRDLPFDQFTIDQLAGDLLPDPAPEQLLATGFLRNTLSNREGGADLEEFRVEQVVDRTRMVGTGWLGLTVGCARCHDHKFDPLSQQEFFELYAILDQADEVNRDLPLPGEQERFEERYAEYRRQRDALLEPVRPQLEALQARWEARLLEAAASPFESAVWTRQWEVLGLIWGGELGEGQLEGCLIVQTPVAQRTPDERDRLLDYFLARGSLIDEPQFRELKLAELAEQLNRLRSAVPWPTRAPTMRQARIARPVYVHTRGDFRVPGHVVQPRLPQWLSPSDHAAAANAAEPAVSLQSAASSSTGPVAAPLNRLDLARWLVSPQNPLTARVVVNRMWQEFFGRGLVDPPDDFGLRGQPPSHPELLDWLASEFIASGWSVKHMHRLIVTSATYRQSSEHRPEVHARDPQNRWLARQLPLRFSADQVRDVALSVSGLLQPRIGGPSVFPPQPETVASEGFSNQWQASEGADRYRRGVYTWLQRLSPFAQNVTFDAPPTNTSCTRRDRSNSPLQALTLLNDAVFFEAAQACARRLWTDRHADEQRRLQALVQLTLSRPATAKELRLLSEYLQDQRQLLQADPEAVSQLAPVPVDGVELPELAAWTGVCSVVLNLHEFVTRE